jgi:hypothetical protein
MNEYCGDFLHSFVILDSAEEDQRQQNELQDQLLTYYWTLENINSYINFPKQQRAIYRLWQKNTIHPQQRKKVK